MARSLLLALALILVPFAAQAQDFSSFQSLSTGSDDSTPPIPAVVVDQPPQIQWDGDEVFITHSLSQDILPSGVGVMCPTAPTTIWRLFDLAEFDIDTEFNLTSVDIGVREVGTQAAGTTNVRLYTVDGEFTHANMTQVAETTLDLDESDVVIIKNVDIEVTFAEGDVVALAWEQPVPNIFFGGNMEGETGLTYLTADACGAIEPTWVGALGDFENHFWVANLRGNTGVSSEEGASATLTLSEVFPNPAVHSSTIAFSLQEASDIQVTMFDALGRQVANLANGTYTAGDHSLSVDVNGLSTGMYIYRIATETEVVTGRLTVVR